MAERGDQLAGMGNSEKPASRLRVVGGTGDGRTVRLALAYFFSPQALAGVPGDFFDRHLDPGRLCLLGRNDPLKRAVVHIEAGAQVQLMDSSHRLSWLGPDPVWLAGRGPDANELFQCCFAVAGPNGYPAWLTDAHYQRLKRHVAEDGLVLMISSDSAVEHDLCCRLLLKHSQGGLQTHDFSCRLARSLAAPS